MKSSTLARIAPLLLLGLLGVSVCTIVACSQSSEQSGSGAGALCGADCDPSSDGYGSSGNGYGSSGDGYGSSGYGYGSSGYAPGYDGSENNSY